MTEYTVSWSIDLDVEGGPVEAAQQAYDSFMRPGSIAHVFEVVTVEDVEPDEIDDPGTESLKISCRWMVDLDRGRDSNRDGEPISYPLSENEKAKVQARRQVAAAAYASDEEDQRVLRKHNDDEEVT